MEGSRPLDPASALAQIEPRLRRASENPEGVITGAVFLAQRRAELLGRSATQDDLEYVLAVFCWWPFKTEPPPEVTEQLVKVRRYAFDVGSTVRLADIVPDSTLTADRESIAIWQREGVSSFLNVDFLDLSDNDA